MTMEKCNQCLEVKDRSEFYIEKRTKRGVRAKCKSCMAINTSNFWRLNPEKLRDRDAEIDIAKLRARKRARRAIYDGRIVPGRCEKCGEPRVDAHHDDYSQPLKIRWLCRRHHAEHHSALRIEI